MDKRTATTATAVALVLLAGCGGTAAHHTAATTLAATTEPAGAYDEVVSAIEHAGVAVCPPADGGSSISLPRPSAEAATASSAFGYLDGRIYELSPCELPPGHRNELRAYRYPDSATRDAAVRDAAARMTRPTSTFVFRDVYALELWSPNPSLDTATGQAVAEAHAAIARVPQAHHPDVAVSTGAACTPLPDVATERVEIRSFAFCPGTTTVAAGTELTWINDDTVAHTVTSVSGSPGSPFDSGVFEPGRSFTVRFDRPGTYAYSCSLHPGMSGTIVVTG